MVLILILISVIILFMRKLKLICVISIIFIGADLPSSVIKKIDKTIQSLWENEIIKKEKIDISSDRSLGNDNLYKLVSNNNLKGYFVLSKAKSRVDFFDYMIIYKPDLSILLINVLIYREDYGGEIASKRWLNQFIGKSDFNEMNFGTDIQGISGATISARSLTKDVQEVTNNIQALKNKGAL